MYQSGRLLLTFFVGAGCALFLWAATTSNNASYDDTPIRSILAGASTPGLSVGDLDLPALRSFYARSGNMPVWSTGQSQMMLNAINRAAEDGLDPAAYHVGADEFRRPHDTPAAAAEFDVLLTDAALKFARDLRLGRPDARSLDRDIDLPLDGFAVGAALAASLANNRLDAFLSELAPPQPAYARLKAALRRYSSIAANGGWPELPTATTEQYAQDSQLSDLLRRRLSYEDDASAGSTESLPEMVRRFQQRHGLEPDQRVGSKTLGALNVPATERALEIAANMERWRWVPRTLERRYVTINVPDARLDVVEDGRIILSSRVIVGRAGAPTPILRAVATSVTINPPWNVPATIARREILPKLRSNRAYLAAENMVLLNGPAGDPSGQHIDWRTVSAAGFPYRIQQLPGPKNALGQIKLELPNRFDVYLHDTPAQSAFELNERYLSHGCVRVAEIKALASYALTGDPAADVAALSAAVEAGSTQHIALSEPMPIYFLYWTVFVDDDGAVEFRKDIYGRDRRLLDFLGRRAPRQQVTSNTWQCERA